MKNDSEDWISGMKVLISGASGFLGREICSLLAAKQHEVHGLVRDPAKARKGDVLWRPSSPLEAAQIAEFDVIVHLAGKPVATLWTEQAKAEIRSSRVAGTANIARAAAQAFVEHGKPHALICSSAIGYYGSRGDEALVEESEVGLDFWPRSAATGREPRIRRRWPGFEWLICARHWCWTPKAARWRRCFPLSAWEWPESWAADASGGAG